MALFWAAAMAALIAVNWPVPSVATVMAVELLVIEAAAELDTEDVVLLVELVCAATTPARPARPVRIFERMVCKRVARPKSRLSERTSPQRVNKRPRYTM